MATPESFVKPPTESWTQVGELHMRYLDWGGEGQPVMALHGLASSAHWYDIVAPLLNGHCRVIAPDQRGHGQTTQATGGYDWQTLAEDTVGLMDYLGVERTTVFGHSWGGNVAIALAARFPERIDRLVMIDGGFLGGRSPIGATWEEFSSRLRPRDVTGRREEFLDRLRTQLADCWSDQLEFIVQTMVYEDEEGTNPGHFAAREPCPSNVVHVERAAFFILASHRMSHASGPRRATPRTRRLRLRQDEAANGGGRGPNYQGLPGPLDPQHIHDIGYHKPQELAKLIIEFLEE